MNQFPKAGGTFAAASVQRPGSPLMISEAGIRLLAIQQKTTPEAIKASMRHEEEQKSRQTQEQDGNS